MVDKVQINLGTAAANGADGDSNRTATQKLVDGLNAVIDAVNAGGGGGGTGGTVDLAPVNARIDQEITNRTQGDNDVRAYVDQQIAALPTGGGGTGDVTQAELDAETAARSQGDTDLRAYVDDAIAGLGASGNATYKATGTGAVTRTLKSKLDDLPTNVQDFYNSTTDGGDYGPAFNRAFAAGHLRCDLPGKTINVNNPINPPEQMHVEGIHRPIGGSLSTVVAPKGFIFNSRVDSTGASGAGNRVHFTLRNFTISAGSSGTGTSSLVKGSMGGVFDGVEFLGKANYGIESNSSFLWQIYRCRFNGTFTNSGISVADFNGCRVMDCYFNVGVHRHVDMNDIAPGKGDYQPGFPVVLCGNNHNMGGGSISNGVSTKANRIALVLRGRIRVDDSYFEDESQSGSNSGNIFIDYIANKFDAGGLVLTNNEMNGLGHTLHEVVIRGQGTPTRCNGVIAYNRMGGNFNNTAQIHFGDVGASTNAKVEGLMIHDNVDGHNVLAVIENGSPYRPLAHSQQVLATPLSIAGSTYVKIPISATAGIVTDNRNQFLTGAVYNIDKTGYWKISCQLTVICTGTTDYPNVGAGIFINGVEVEFGNESLNAISGKRVSGNIFMETLQMLKGGDDITVQAHNGEAVSQYSFTAQFISEEGWN